MWLGIPAAESYDLDSGYSFLWFIKEASSSVFRAYVLGGKGYTIIHTVDKPFSLTLVLARVLWRSQSKLGAEPEQKPGWPLPGQSPSPTSITTLSRHGPIPMAGGYVEREA